MTQCFELLVEQLEQNPWFAASTPPSGGGVFQLIMESGNDEHIDALITMSKAFVFIQLKELDADYDMDTESKVTFIRGTVGSGKSTLGKNYAQEVLGYRRSQADYIH